MGLLSTIIGLGADFGISSLIGNVVTTCTTKTNNKIIDKICIGIGTAVAAGMVGEAAQNYIDRKFDEFKKILPGSKEEEAEDGGEEVSR